MELQLETELKENIQDIEYKVHQLSEKIDELSNKIIQNEYNKLDSLPWYLKVFRSELFWSCCIFFFILSLCIIGGFLFEKEYMIKAIFSLITIISSASIFLFLFNFVHNLQYESKPSILSKLKKKLLYKCNSILDVKNRGLISKKEILIQQVQRLLTDSLMKDIFSFYKDHPFKPGTNENLILAINLNKIETDFKNENYNDILSIYLNDKKKFSYDVLKNQI